MKLKNLAFIPLIFCLSGCTNEIVSETPIDKRYTPPYTALETDWQHKYSVLQKKWVYRPVQETVMHKEEYEILYQVQYDDGDTMEYWKTVTKQEYDDVVIE